jgi:hypothetical protein
MRRRTAYSGCACARGCCPSIHRNHRRRSRRATRPRHRTGRPSTIQLLTGTSDQERPGPGLGPCYCLDGYAAWRAEGGVIANRVAAYSCPARLTAYRTWVRLRAWSASRQMERDRGGCRSTDESRCSGRRRWSRCHEAVLPASAPIFGPPRCVLPSGLAAGRPDRARLRRDLSPRAKLQT